MKHRLHLFPKAPSVSFDAAMYTASEADSQSEIITIIMTEPCLRPFYEILVNNAEGTAEGKHY